MKVKASDIARVSENSKANISQETKRKNLVRGSDKKYDLKNVVNKSWLQQRNLNEKDFTDVGSKSKKKTKPLKKSDSGQKKKVKKNVKKVKIESISDFESLSGLPDKYMDMTIKQIIFKHGDLATFKLYVDVLEKLMSARKKDIEASEKRNQLIPRSTVEFLKAYIDIFTNQLFDYAESAGIEIIPLVLADPEKAKKKLPNVLIKIFSKLAKETKRKINLELKKNDHKLGVEEKE